MTVIACRKTKEGYEIASDSITVRGYTQTVNNTNKSKLVRISDSIVLGSTGTVEESSLFQIFLKTHLPSRNDENAILDLLSEFSEWKYNKTNDSNIDNYYILCIDDVAYVIHGYLVEKIDTFEAIGAGMDFALAAMHLGHSAKEAVSVAIELSIYCEYPVIEIINKGTE